jgi:hypothetical protein
LKVPSFYKIFILEVPFFICITLINIILLFFCEQSILLFSVYSGRSTLQILRLINSSEIPKLILKSIVWLNLFWGVWLTDLQMMHFHIMMSCGNTFVPFNTKHEENYYLYLIYRISLNNVPPWIVSPVKTFFQSIVSPLNSFPP